jgi:hypothetical protein
VRSGIGHVPTVMRESPCISWDFADLYLRSKQPDWYFFGVSP